MDTDHNTAPEDGVGSGAELPSAAVWAAGLFAFSSTLISLVAIWMQLKNYRKPLLQRFVVRILWMVPIFAISSWISLVSLDMAFYVDAFRDIYEAFVIYCFFNLLVCYLGGERSLLVMLHGRPYTKHLWPVSLWSREMDVGDPYTFLFIKRGILQYVYVKPILAAVTMLLKSNGAYNDGSISLKSGYFWVSFVYNVSANSKVPVYQGGIMSNTSPDTAVAIQDFLICLEMIPSALMHWYAFSHKDYTELDIHSARMPIYYAVRDASGIKDIIQDSLETLKGTRFTYRTFEPSEGVATVGMSRSGRIMAGLRYTGGGAAKYWLPDADKISRDGLGGENSAGLDNPGMGATSSHLRPDYPRNPHSYSQQGLGSSSYTERAPSLYFADVDEEDDDGMEELYGASKQLKFGDYNFPAIDVFDPKRSKESDRRKMARKNKKKARQYGEASSLLGGGGFLSAGEGADAGEETRPLMSESGRTGTTFGKSEWDHGHSAVHVDGTDDKESGAQGSSGARREGCVDNVNGYVPDLKSKRKKGPSHPPSIPPAQSHSQVGQANNSHYGGAYDTYGFGYQSYQQQGQRPQSNPEIDERESRGPMFFFL
ncbi:hypothetical protein EC968_000318 [Mortierella alpina]|nr:hypothetical protein EC968_000318 [Mortierella alpina]